MNKINLKDTLDNLGPDVLEVFYYNENGFKLDLTKYTESEFDNLEVIDKVTNTKKIYKKIAHLNLLT